MWIDLIKREWWEIISFSFSVGAKVIRRTDFPCLLAPSPPTASFQADFTCVINTAEFPWICVSGVSSIDGFCIVT